MSKKFTKEQRKEIAAVFRAAKKYLWDGKAYGPNPGSWVYICFAIDETLRKSGKSSQAAANATSVIQARLGSRSCIESWLAHVAKVGVSLLHPANVQAYRHRWLKALIKEFSQ